MQDPNPNGGNYWPRECEAEIEDLTDVPVSLVIFILCAIAAVFAIAAWDALNG